LGQKAEKPDAAAFSGTYAHCGIFPELKKAGRTTWAVVKWRVFFVSPERLIAIRINEETGVSPASCEDMDDRLKPSAWLQPELLLPLGQQ
jgi:hypothetical protein